MLKNLAKIMGVAVAGMVLAACPPTPIESDAPNMGSFDGTFRGAAWRGRAYAVLRNDSLTVVGHRPDPATGRDEYVQARVRFTGPIMYEVPESAGQIAEIVGGDAGSFLPASGTLTISYDAQAKTVTGTLSLTAASVSPAWTASGTFIAAPVFSSFSEVPPAR